MLDLVLTDVAEVLGVRVGSPVVASDHSIIFKDVVQEKPIPRLVCRQEVNLKNSVDLEVVRGDVKLLNWNRLNRCPCQVSSLNEALLHVIRGRVSKRTIVD